MTQNPIIGYIEKIIDYVDLNIHENLNVDTIASKLHLSRSYLQRIFKSITGISLMDYVRSRKLSMALEALRETEDTIIDIAQSLGYEYEQSFSRAFKSQFGVSPKKFREMPKEVAVTPKMDLSFIVDLKDSIIARPSFVLLPSFQLGGLVHRVTIAEKYDFKPTQLGNDFFFDKKNQIQDPKNPYVYYGYTFSYDPMTDSTQYLTSLEVDHNSVLPEGFVRMDIPEQTYIFFKFIGSFPAEEITWHHLEDIWTFRDRYLRTYHGITERRLGYFEYIDARKSSQDYCEMEIYVPL